MTQEPNYTRVMVDIETLGLDPGASILSIGAVKFRTDKTGAKFYRNINLMSCESAGLTIDAETLEWWLGQGDEAREVLEGGDDLYVALRDFSNFYHGSDEIWAYSPSFDCAHLEHAYDAVGLQVPWTYKETRDCRTLASLPIWPDMEQSGVEHNALDDAKYQARQTIAALNNLDP